MGRFFVVLLATAMLCGIVYHFFPGTTAIAISPGGVRLSWLAMIGVAGLVFNCKLLGK